MTNKEVFKKSIQHYGPKAQIDLAIEEMSELTKALLKHRRASMGQGDPQKKAKDVAEEIADVRIMLDQLEMIFDNKVQVREWIEKKVNRQIQRMEGEDVHGHTDFEETH